MNSDATGKSESGIVYALTNPSFIGPNGGELVKIGFTRSDVNSRIRQLYEKTCVPMPFRCVYAVKVDYAKRAEKLLHATFSERRINSSREFFEVDPESVVAALKLTDGVDVTPPEDIVDNPKESEAIDRAIKTKSRWMNFNDVNLKIGDEIRYVRNENVTAKVSSIKPSKIVIDQTKEVLKIMESAQPDLKEILDGKRDVTLSGSALKLLHHEGIKWSSVSGWDYWVYDDSSLAERARMIRSESNDDEDEDFY